jgi:hypothetical protein
MIANRFYSSATLKTPRADVCSTSFRTVTPISWQEMARKPVPIRIDSLDIPYAGFDAE